jgi:alkyl hydroperoxide reductase subunit AhpC
LKGKVVLLDFTMYSASESAERTIKMRELHDKYRSQGFEIYQISLDDNLSFWKNAVDKLEWICVHETNGQVTASYGVQKLPTFFLINRANEVVVRSDFMEGSLEDNIKKLL